MMVVGDGEKEEEKEEEESECNDKIKFPNYLAN